MGLLSEKKGRIFSWSISLAVLITTVAEKNEGITS